MADLRSTLESTLGNAYVIERELGGGGMARVFLATDRALLRRVVIKVLAPELSAELSAKRFAREVRLAASLQQANIVPVLSAGETEGMPHYVMPFVEGLSLRAKLDRDGRASVSETIEILRDVARALAYAHEHGVVHRDIKPENILLSGDAAVVTDFGVAKAIAVAKLSQDSGGAPRESTVTHIGMAVGTPAYMSPEQISADPSVDHRADIYSLGCVAYELLTGESVFPPGSLPALFAAHLSQRPVPLIEKNPDVPDALATLVMRCLEKDVAHRPQSARDILAALASIPTTESSMARLGRRLSMRQRRAVAIGGTLVLAGVAATVVIRGTIARPAFASVAVIPFYVDGDSTHEYLAEGMSDELATALGKVKGVRVASRSLGYRYKGRRDVTPSDIGHELSVDHVVQGSVFRVGDRLRMSVQLTSVSDNRELWSQTFDATDDAFAIQRSVTRGVAEKLGFPLAAATQRGGTSDSEAYDLYLRGRFLLQRRGAGVRLAVEKFEQAIARDSSFALAHAALALALELQPYFDPVDARVLGPRAIASAKRALAIDSTIGEAHTALALAHQHLYQWRASEQSYLRAIAVNPNETDTHIQYGRFLWYNGRVAEAEPRFARARALDPYSAVASGWHGYLLFLRGTRDEGLKAMRRAVEIDSSNPPSLVFLATAYRMLGDSAQAQRLTQQLWRLVPNWRGVATDFEDSDTLRARLRAFENDLRDSPTRYTRLANIYARLGDSTNFFVALERATERGEIWPVYYSLSDPRFDFVRRSARFAAIVRSVGLDVDIFTSPTGGRIQ